MVALQQLLFSLHSVPSCDQVDQYGQNKTEVLFEKNPEASGFLEDQSLIFHLGQNAVWLRERLLAKKSDKQTRRFLFLSVFLLN